MENSKRNSIREASDILKGIAILAVLINHYLKHYTEFGLGGFANVTVSIFFVLSGYGIFISLNNYLDTKNSYQQILSFYYRRLRKIMPLFWLALILQSLILSSSYKWSSFIGFEPSGHYWFIASILECYLVAPLLAYFINVNIFRTLLITTLLFGISNTFNSYDSTFASVLDFLQLSKKPYLDIHFLPIYLFFLGMCIKKLNLDDYKRIFAKNVPKKFRYALFFLFTFITVFYILAEKIIPQFPLILGLLMLVLLCIYTLKSGILANLITLKFLRFLGIHSFPIYLFHMSYYFLLAKMGYLEQGEPLSIILVILLFPIFILIALGLEKVVTWTVIKISSLPLQEN